MEVKFSNRKMYCLSGAIALVLFGLMGGHSLFAKSAPSCRDKCDLVDNGIQRSFWAILTAQKDYAEQNRYFVVAKSDKRILEDTAKTG